MCNSFVVQNFRTFQELKIQKLSKVNLFVGKNSIGKTALLEAFHLYLHTNKEKAIYQLLTKREEHLSDRDLASVIKHLFYNHILSSPNKEGIVLSTLSSTSKVIASKALKIQTTFDKTVDEAYLSIKTNKTNDDYRLARDFKDFHRRSQMFFDRDIQNTPNNLRFVYSSGINNNDVAKLWDEIAFSDKQDKVIKALKIVEPNLSDVAFIEVANRNRKERMAIVKINNEKIPFRSMGDGINRILHIALSMVNAQNGYLLIDEFENGLHYSTQEKLWEFIFKLSQAFNVQIFATTHSNDCIKAFGSQWQGNKESATLHRIDYYDKQHTVMPYKFEDLDSSLSTNTEIR